MTPIWIASIIVQWLVIAALCLLILSLVRQVGELLVDAQVQDPDADAVGARDRARAGAADEEGADHRARDLGREG